jgi:hypothetical protein
MPIYWNPVDPPGTLAIPEHDLLSQVAVVPINEATGGQHPVNPKLGYISGDVPLAPIDFPATYISPPIRYMGQRVSFQDKKHFARTNVKFNTTGGMPTGMYGLTKAELQGQRTFVIHIRGSGGDSTTGYTLNSDRAAGGGGSSMVCLLDLIWTYEMENVLIDFEAKLAAGPHGGSTTFSINGDIVLIASGGGGASRGTGGSAGECAIMIGGIPQPISNESIGTVFYTAYASVKILAFFPGSVGGIGTGSVGAPGRGSYQDPYIGAPSFSLPVYGEYNNEKAVGEGGAAPPYGVDNANEGSVGMITIYY